ncbi:MAG: sensor histidine kinase [Kiritimatiellia bacterium]
MLRAVSTRRSAIAYAVAAAAIVLLVGNLFHFRQHVRRNQRDSREIEILQRAMAAAWREIPPDRFAAWLEQADLRQADAPGGNVYWLAPDGFVRWSASPEPIPPESAEAFRKLAAAGDGYPRSVRVRLGGRPFALHLQPLAAGDPGAGAAAICAPVPRYFLDAGALWISTALMLALYLGILFLYHRRIRARFFRLLRKAGLENLPPPGPGEALEAWTRRYVATASRKIAEERSLFDSLFDILQDGILFLDGENRILRANAAAALMLDGEPGALIGRSLAETAQQPALAELADSIRGTGTYQASEIHLPTIPGLGHVAGIPLRAGQDGRRGQLMFVMRDLTRLRRLESAGEEYATNVSHELKTPLTLILGFTETLLTSGALDPETRERHLRTIERHAKRILRIIDDLLRLAWLRNEAGTVGIPRAPVLVGAAVAAAVDTCREWARSAGIAIETHVPENLVWPLNEGLVEEAIVNLVKNAILYALVGPVEIRARTLDGGYLELAVIDRGPGLKPGDAKRIFDRFYRADKSRSRTSGGSGLGLPIVQQIVEAHHGNARVETAPGEGCAFILEFPPAPGSGPIP